MQNITKHIDLSYVETYQKEIYFTQASPEQLDKVVEWPTAKKFLQLTMHDWRRIAVSSIYSYWEADALDKFRLFLVKDLPKELQEKCSELIQKYEQPEWKDSKRKLKMEHIDRIMGKWIDEQQNSYNAQEATVNMASAVLKAREAMLAKKIPDEYKWKELSGDEVNRVLDAREKQDKVKKE